MTIWLVAMRGLPGCGKSTVARALSRRLGWPLIDKDDVKDVLHRQALDTGRLAYDVMLRVARRQLLQGLSVICDSPLIHPALYERAQRIAAESGATLAIVECVCSDEAIWRERIDGRKTLNLPDHHQTDWAGFQAYRAALPKETDYPITGPHLVADTIRPLDQIVTEVINWLNDAGQERAG